MSKPWENVNYSTPPKNRGQIVTVSYGCDADYIYRRTVDASDRTTVYSRFEHTEEVFKPWDRKPKLGDEVPFTKDEADWEEDAVASYVATYPNGDDDGAANVCVYIGQVAGHWFLKTEDDAGGDDECDDATYETRSAAVAAAAEFAVEHDEAEQGEDAADYLKRQLEETAGEPDPDGEYCVYWDTSLDDSGPGKRYASPEAATAAAELANQGLRKHNPGGNLLCGYEPRRLQDGEWVSLDQE